MKKIIALILATVLLFSTMTIVAGAEEGADSIQCVNGDTVTVMISLSESYDDIKGASIEFAYDENVFEYVSYKWIPTLTIKSYNYESKQGVAATNAKTWSGDLFELKLKVNENAEYADYDIDATVQLMTNDNDFIILDFKYTVSVVEYIEIDDATTPEDFEMAVDNISNAGADEDTYACIIDALATYSALTTAEKEEAAEAYSELLNIIENYNSASDAINADAQSATSIAFSALSNALAYLSQLFEALRQMIWN